MQVECQLFMEFAKVLKNGKLIIHGVNHECGTLFETLKCRFYIIIFVK
jgi:hypothetical protein